MFYHNIIRITKKENIATSFEAFIKTNRFLIFPLFEPNSDFGKYLADKNKSAVLSEYSGENTDIIYLSSDNKKAYHSFIEQIIETIAKESKIRITESSFIIVFPNMDDMLVMDGHGKKNIDELNILLSQIIDCTRSKNPKLSFKGLKVKLFINVNEVIKSILYIFFDVMAKNV